MFSTIEEALEVYKLKCRQYVTHKVSLHRTYGSRIPMAHLQDEIREKKTKLITMERVIGLSETEAAKIKKEFGASQFPEADPPF